MPKDRHLAQGTLNIIRFNWPFFTYAGLAAMGLSIVLLRSDPPFSSLLLTALTLLLLGLLIPLTVSFYIYDLSKLYLFPFLKNHRPKKVINLTAGFDESSAILRQKFPSAELLTFDFYQEDKHTEASIRRARTLYPPPSDSRPISTSKIPLPTAQADLILAFFSLHEIRSPRERICFLNEIKRTLSPQGEIIIVEHLRDLPNFLAYSLGFFHFHSHRTWQRAFTSAGLHLSRQEAFTPFLRIYTLTQT